MFHLEIPQLQFPEHALPYPLLHRGPVQEGDSRILFQQLENDMHTSDFRNVGKIRQADILDIQILLQDIPGSRPRLPYEQMFL